MKFADLDLSKTYTYADYFKWQFEERVELIKGKIFRMSPAPSRIHQKITGVLHARLWTFLEDKPCEVYDAPFDVRIPRRSKDDKEIITVLQPDVCVICDLGKLDKRGCLGAPDIVVEVLSPGNNAKELRNKYAVYEEAGVKEYWIVSPQDQWLRVHTLVDDKFIESPYYIPGDNVTSGVLPSFSLSLADLFKGIDPNDC
ncbi:MAG: Uma2 family endonuclease [Bacteroidota bacterium]